MFVAGGAAAVHCLAGDADGNLYSWGRNEVRAKFLHLPRPLLHLLFAHFPRFSILSIILF